VAGEPRCQLVERLTVPRVFGDACRRPSSRATPVAWHLLTADVSDKSEGLRGDEVPRRSRLNWAVPHRPAQDFWLRRTLRRSERPSIPPFKWGLGRPLPSPLVGPNRRRRASQPYSPCELWGTRLLQPAPRVQDTSGGDPSWRRDALLLSQRGAAGITPSAASSPHGERPRSSCNIPTPVTPASCRRRASGTKAGTQVTRPREIGPCILPRQPHCCPRIVPLMPTPRCTVS
jgi:hypothetical protein